jgi:pSer/pThr/pTyr-binding forkhead associated (FHA) protein
MVSTTMVISVVAAVVAVIVIVAVVRGIGSKGPLGSVTITKGPREGETFVLEAGRTQIGALEQNDIVLPSKQVSRYHAELRSRGSRVYLWDLRARNHTYVNGEQVETAELSPGDVITIGDAELRYDR